MTLSKAKYFIYGILMSVLLVVAIAQAASPDGVFGKYFENITLACDYDTDVITGHITSGSDYGKRICTSFKSLLGKYYKTLAPAPANQALVGFDNSGNPEYISVITTSVLDSKLGTLCTSMGGLWNNTLGTCSGVGGGGGGACVPNGSCSAATPACNTTTTGVDNCGGACTKTGGSCACVSNGSCSAATPACDKTTSGVDNCGNSCTKTGGSCACVSNGSCSAATPACDKTTSGVDNCGKTCTKTGAACVYCPGGHVHLDSPDKSNVCDALWGKAPVGSSAPAFMITNIGGGILEGTCNKDGEWDYTYKCPNKVVVSCTGGGVTLTSPDKTNTCRYDWANVSAGSSVTVVGSNGGTLNGTCSPAGAWNYSYNCPNKVVPACPGGGTSLNSSDNSNTCSYTWSNVSAGTSQPFSGTNGGTLNGTCSSVGTWSYSYTCPNKVTKSCPGGSTPVPSAKKPGVTCTFSWGLTTAGTPAFNVSGTNGGVGNIQCLASGTWQVNSVSCP